MSLLFRHRFDPVIENKQMGSFGKNAPLFLPGGMKSAPKTFRAAGRNQKEDWQKSDWPNELKEAKRWGQKNVGRRFFCPHFLDCRLLILQPRKLQGHERQRNDGMKFLPNLLRTLLCALCASARTSSFPPE